MEKRLKEDILNESKIYNDNILIHDEQSSGNVLF